MRLFILLALVLGGFSLPAHASEEIRRCGPNGAQTSSGEGNYYKLVKSNDALFNIRNVKTGFKVAEEGNRTDGETKLDYYCTLYL